ncbi:MAG: phosphoribosyl-AMP cyclohydrolase [Nanoarchaeota archaeon]|nr:phosphoribosyl-AMP cyclohydrolase [Nanoarchaeota archaeon]
MENKEQEEGLELMLKLDGQGLLPVVVQDCNTRDVLMLGYANEQALRTTFETGYATFYSRSRDEIWTKGLTSGNTLAIKDVRVDCDQDALIYLVEKTKGGACHTLKENGDARNSCFYRCVNSDFSLEFLEK